MTSTASTGAQLIAKWGRLKNARKDVVKRFVCKVRRYVGATLSREFVNVFMRGFFNQVFLASFNKLIPPFRVLLRVSANGNTERTI